MAEQKAGNEWSDWYNKYSGRLLIIPTLMLILSLVYLASFYAKTGDIIRKDITLTGGTSITVYTSEKIDVAKAESELSSKVGDGVIRILTDLRTGEQIAFSAESRAEPEQLKDALASYLNYQLDEKNSNTEFTGASLSKSFSKELMMALILAFLFMAIAVFFIFKTFFPSMIVILSAFTDIILTIAIIDLIGMRISAAGISALLMLIGYSVDTDILLTNRLLRKEREIKDIFERLKGAFMTGITMTLTSIAVVLLSYFMVFSPVLKEVFIILAIGLSIDILATWITNASLLKWYCDKKSIK